VIKRRTPRKERAKIWSNMELCGDVAKR